jgi:D-amino-acid dehydrogenase
LNVGFTVWLLRFLRYCNRRSYERGAAALSALGRDCFHLLDDLAGDGLAFEMHARGNLHVSATVDGAQKALEALAVPRELGLGVPRTIMRQEELLALEPALSTAARAGFLLPQERHVEPLSFVRALVAGLRGTGARLCEHTTALRVERKRAGVEVLTSAGPLRARAAVVAAGVSTPGILDRRRELPVHAGKGYSFSVSVQPAPLRPIMFGDARVGVSPFSDCVRVLGTMEFSGDNLRLDTRRLKAMAKAGARYLSGWPTGVGADDGSGAIKDPWVGMRPMTPDGLPLVDEVPGLGGVFVNTGHAMLGVTLALPTGKALAEYISTGRKPAVLQPFTVSRF